MEKVAARSLGRLGNQMFVAVGVKTYAKMYNKEFIGLLQWQPTEALIKYNTQDDYIKKTILRNVPEISLRDVDGFAFYPPIGHEADCLRYDFAIPQLPGNILLNSHFQDIRYIDKEIAYDLFGIYDSIKQEINELYGDLSNCVCVNVRRADYLLPQHIGTFKTLKKQEIEDILKKYFPNDKILFVSDDIAWCKENFKCDRFMFADKPCNNKIEMDLYLQSQCRDNVISNSTFSWWGAYLNPNPNKKVICPWPWFKTNDMPCNYLLPNEWIKFTYIK